MPGNSDAKHLFQTDSLLSFQNDEVVRHGLCSLRNLGNDKKKGFKHVHFDHPRLDNLRLHNWFNRQNASPRTSRNGIASNHLVRNCGVGCRGANYLGLQRATAIRIRSGWFLDVGDRRNRSIGDLCECYEAKTSCDVN